MREAEASGLLVPGHLLYRRERDGHFHGYPLEMAATLTLLLLLSKTGALSVCCYVQ